MACIVSFNLSFHKCFLHKESKPVVIKYGIVFPKCAFPFYMIMQNLTEFTAESTVCLLVPFWSLALLGSNYPFVAIIDYNLKFFALFDFKIMDCIPHTATAHSSFTGVSNGRVGGADLILTICIWLI